jgi:hypothetical protein
MIQRFSRRAVLRAASGAALSLPLLPSLGPRTVKAQDQGFPKRLVLMYTPNGVVHDSWWPSNVTSETEFTLGPIHQPLEAYRDRLLIVGGLEMQVAATGPGGPHQRGIGALFTNMPLGEGMFVDGCGRTAGWATGISVDQRVANQIGADSAIGSLQIGVRASENDVQGRVSYAGPAQPLPPINSPLELYKRLFTGFTPPPSSDRDATVTEFLAQRKSVLDGVADEFAALMPQLSAPDRHTLEQHLTLVRDVERRLAGGIGDCTVPDEPAALDPLSEVDMPAIAELELDLLSLAFACDITRVATFQVSTALNRIRYPWVESLGEGHTLSHSGPSDAAAKTQLTTRARWHASLVARLLENLSKIPEGPGSALDNLLLLWGNEVSEGATHTHDNMPFLLAGGGWAFRTGRYLRYGGESHADLLVSVLNAMGVDQQTFGSADFCKGPLSGLA